MGAFKAINIALRWSETTVFWSGFPPLLINTYPFIESSSRCSLLAGGNANPASQATSNVMTLPISTYHVHAIGVQNRM
jgi:hypothetical protein